MRVHIHEGRHDDATGAFDRLDRRRDDPVPVRIADLVDVPGADHDVDQALVRKTRPEADAPDDKVHHDSLTWFTAPSVRRAKIQLTLT